MRENLLSMLEISKIANSESINARKCKFLRRFESLKHLCDLYEKKKCRIAEQVSQQLFFKTNLL